jgi:GAF domain-containing protein
VRTLGIRSGLASSIVVDGKLWGAITLASLGRSLPPGTERQLAGFTEMVATALANAQARDALSRLADEQAGLRRVATLVAQGASPDDLFSAVAEDVAAVIDIPVVGVHRYEADGTFTMLGIAGETSFTPGSRWPVEPEGLAGQILATGRPTRKDDYSTMPGPLGDALRADQMVTTIGAPIVVDGSIWGFMVAGGRPGKAIPAGTEERLDRFIELVTTAIAKHKEQEHRAWLTEEQAALRRVATLVARGVSPDELFAAVSNEVATLFGAEIAAIGRFELLVLRDDGREGAVDSEAAAQVVGAGGQGVDVVLDYLGGELARPSRGVELGAEEDVFPPGDELFVNVRELVEGQMPEPGVERRGQQQRR